MNYFDYLDSTGYILKLLIPGACIDDCTAPSQDATEAVQYWVRKLQFDAPVDAARAYLQGFGAWDDEELADHGANLERLLWSVCNDERERYSDERSASHD